MPIYSLSSGTITESNIVEGKQVTEGDLLIAMDRRYEENYQQLQLQNLESAQNRLIDMNNNLGLIFSIFIFIAA